MPIFFSLDPDQFTHYKSCTIANGSTVYSNHSIPNDCSCVAPIGADPDFGGPGVIASFCFLAWLTILVATVPAFYGIRDSWRRSKPPYRAFQFLQAIFSIQIHEDNPRDSTGWHDRGEATPTSSGIDGIVDDKSRAEPVSLPNAAPIPKPIQIANALLVSLTDIQIFTGLAILIAAFAQARRISFYHEQFAVNLWWLTLNSIWVSRIDYNEDSPLMDAWRMQARRCFLITSVMISAALQLWTAIRERDHWNPLDGSKCYIGSGLGNNFGQNIFWLAGTLLYGCVLLLGVFHSSRRWVDQRIFERVPRSLGLLSHRVQESHHRYSKRRDFTSFFKLLANAVVFVVWWAFVQFLSIWSAGNTSHALELIVYTIFAASNTWWVIALKVSNRHLVRGDESRWTTGQSLPVMLTGLVVFAGLDAVT